MRIILRLLGVALIFLSSVFALCDDDSSSSKSVCRTYATYFTDSEDLTYSCTFDTETDRYTCEISGGGTLYRQYDSKARFIDEAKAIGRIYHTQYYMQFLDEIQNLTYEYDPADTAKLIKKTQHHSSGNDFPTTYTEWDGNKRPTAGTIDYSPLDPACAAMPVAIAYDDASRTREESTTSDISACSSAVWTETITYDQNGDVIRMEIDGEYGTTVFTNTIVETARICE